MQVSIKSDVKCSDVGWTVVIYVKCSDVGWTVVIYVKRFYFKVKWSEVKWSEVKWSEVKWSEMKWSEVSYGEVLVDKGAMYIRVTLYCGHLIILRPFNLGIFCTVCFNLYCGGFILFCNVCVCVCGFFVMWVLVWVL
jgi:hypothetical protein